MAHIDSKQSLILNINLIKYIPDLQAYPYSGKYYLEVINDTHITFYNLVHHQQILKL